MCVFANNTISNANDVGAVFKLHNGNTKDSSSTWTGVYTELIEISDNLFSGTSGATLVETAPQNPSSPTNGCATSSSSAISSRAAAPMAGDRCWSPR